FFDPANLHGWNGAPGLLVAEAAAGWPQAKVALAELAEHLVDQTVGLAGVGRLGDLLGVGFAQGRPIEAAERDVVVLLHDALPDLVEHLDVLALGQGWKRGEVEVRPIPALAVPGRGIAGRLGGCGGPIAGWG